MNQKIVIAFLLVTISAVLAHPGFARDDAIGSPVAVALDAAAAPAPSSEAPAAPAIPEEQPTSPALLDDATGKKSFFVPKKFSNF